MSWLNGLRDACCTAPANGTIMPTALWLNAITVMSFGSTSANPPLPNRGRRVALVIGNATYSHAPPLSNPSNDARDVATKLSGLGFEVVGGEHDGIDLAYGDMAARLRDFGRRLREGSDVETALMFFAGHGLQVDGRNYLVPIR